MSSVCPHRSICTCPHRGRCRNACPPRRCPHRGWRARMAPTPAHRSSPPARCRRSAARSGRHPRLPTLRRLRRRNRNVGYPRQSPSRRAPGPRGKGRRGATAAPEPSKGRPPPERRAHPGRRAHPTQSKRANCMRGALVVSNLFASALQVLLRRNFSIEYFSRRVPIRIFPSSAPKREPPGSAVGRRTSPRPTERKSQPRRGSPKSVWPPKVPTVPSPRPHQTSFMCTLKILVPKVRMNFT